MKRPKCAHDNRTGARLCESCGHRLAEVVLVKPQTPPSLEPASSANGRYQVKRLLGEGGMKRVYLTYGTKLDQDVTFSRIKTERLDGTVRTRIPCEVRATGRLLSA